MATFTMPKSYDDIEQAVALPEGIYRMRSVAPPQIQENKAKTGMNLVVEVAIFGETDPTANGRTFMKWFSFPTAADAEKRTKRGQTFLDFKMERLRSAIEGLGGSIDGAQIHVPEEFECRWAVIQKLNQETQQIENELDGDPLPA